MGYAGMQEILKYPDDSAGSLMTTEYEALKLHLKVSEALQKIKNDGIDKETINTCYVIDRNRKLLGTVTLRSLLFADPDIEVGDIMTENVISVTTLTDQEDVARDFQKYDFSVMPVVDIEDRLVGIITVESRASMPLNVLDLQGIPITGSVVFAAMAPARCAAMPAAAIIAPNPRSLAPAAKSAASSGVL